MCRNCGLTAILLYFLQFREFLHIPAAFAVKLPKLDVAGSIPVSRSIFSSARGTWSNP
jgi:hypothetical protein